MTKNLRVSSVVALLLLSGCTSIPDAVLEQDLQRRLLFAQCKTFIETFAQATDPTRVNLAPCWQHQRLAGEIIDYYYSLSKEREVTPYELGVLKRVHRDLQYVGIKLCYATVRLGKEVKDTDGRTGIAVCDRDADEKRHQETLEAIRRAAMLWGSW